MNCKHRIQSFWKYFLLRKPELEDALRVQDEQRTADLIREINVELERVCGCKVEIELNEDGFFEMTFDTGPSKTVQYITELMKQCAPKELVEDWIINAWLPPYSAKARNALLKIKDSKKLIITPHIAWASVEARNRLMQIIVGQIKDFFG